MEDDILSAPAAPSPSIDEQDAKVELVEKPSVFHPYFKKLFIPFLAGLVLIVGLGVSLSLVQQRQNISSQASVDRVDLPLSAVSTISPDQNITVAVGINTQSYKATAVQLELTYPAGKYDFVSLAPVDFLTTVLTTGSGGNGIASIILGSGTTPRQGSGILAVLTLHSKANTSGTTEISVSPNTVVTGADAAGNAVSTSILGDAGSTTVTIADTAESPSPTLSASPTASPTAASSSTPSPTPTPAKSPTPTPAGQITPSASPTSARFSEIVTKVEKTTLTNPPRSPTPSREPAIRASVTPFQDIHPTTELPEVSISPTPSAEFGESPPDVQPNLITRIIDSIVNFFLSFFEK